MDNIDYKNPENIAEECQGNRINISKEIHLSVSAVIERIRKLRRAGSYGNTPLLWMRRKPETI